MKGPCWFCLGSPEVEKHLVVSVGDDVSTLLSIDWITCLDYVSVKYSHSISVYFTFYCIAIFLTL